MNYSSITATIRCIHQATLGSKNSGIPVTELLDQDKDLRRKLQAQRLEDKQRREFIKTIGGIERCRSCLVTKFAAKATTRNKNFLFSHRKPLLCANRL